jgi:hypothetical protein
MTDGPLAPLRQRLNLSVAPLKEATQVIVAKHYLHRGRTMAQVAYWVHLDDARVGVLLFALPRLSVRFQGYHPMELIELARVWIDPVAQGREVIDRSGRQHTLAVTSCAVGAGLRRIRSDWQLKYPHLPELRACVSWADVSLHVGTIYRAANFAEVGVSGGKQPGKWARPNGGRHQPHADYSHHKQTFLYVWAGVPGVGPGENVQRRKRRTMSNQSGSEATEQVAADAVRDGQPGDQASAQAEGEIGSHSGHEDSHTATKGADGSVSVTKSHTYDDHSNDD